MEVSSVYGGYQNQMEAMRAMRKPPAPTGEMAEDMSDKIMSSSDGDGDGLLSSSELGFSDELFTNMDSDGDGSVSSSELKSGLSNNWESFGSELMTKLKESGFEPPQGPEGMGPPPGGERPDIAETILSESDEDGDGSLSSEELGFSDESFEALDVNGDGVVSSEELQAGLSAEGGREQFGEEVKAKMSSLGYEPPQQSAQMKQGMAAYSKQLNLTDQLMNNMDTDTDATSFWSGLEFGASYDQAV